MRAGKNFRRLNIEKACRTKIENLLLSDTLFPVNKTAENNNID